MEENAMISIRDGPKLQDTGPIQEGQKLKQYIAGFCATLGAFAAGTALAWTAPILPVLKGNDSFLPVTEMEGAWVGALMPIGGFVGSLPAGLVADSLGRKMTVAALSAPFLISWLLIAFANNVAMLFAARFIGGLATGATSVAATMYVAEIGEVSVKGALGSFFQLQVTIGILFTFVLGGAASYSGLAVACGVIPVLWLVSVLFLPETPVFLLKKGRIADAERALRWLRGPGYDIKRELGAMQRAADEAAKSSGPRIANPRAAIKALVICLGLMVFQQFSGVNAIMFYTVQIFEAAGSTLSPNIATIIVGVVQVVSTGITALIVDKAGRRILLLGSGAVASLCLGVLGLYFHMKAGGSDVSALGWLPLACVVLFIVVFSLAFGPIPWMMTGDLFPSNLQGPASTVVAATNWIMAFIVTFIFQSLLNTLKDYGTFWLFSACCAAAVVFVFVLVPETKGKENDEIQAILGGSGTGSGSGRPRSSRNGFA